MKTFKKKTQKNDLVIFGLLIIHWDGTNGTTQGWVHLCNKNKNGGEKKPWEKKKNINLVLLHVNHTFLILEPKPLDTFIVP